MRVTGGYETSSAGGEEVRAFVPHALPPANPPVQITGAAIIQLVPRGRHLTARARDFLKPLERIQIRGPKYLFHGGTRVDRFTQVRFLTT